MIEKLTQEQIDKMPLYVDRWLKIALSTEPLDFGRAKEAAIKCYEIAGLEPPKYFYHFESPYSAATGAAILGLGGSGVDKNQVRDQVEDQVEDQVRDQVKHQVEHQVEDQVRDQVRDQVGAQVWRQVRDQVEEQVWAHVGAQVWHQVGAAQVWAQVWAQVEEQIWGARNAEWLAFYDFLTTELNIKYDNKLSGLIELSKHCGGWAPYENAVILQDRPYEINWDDQKRLHCEDGPAIKYRDGFCVHSWHGTRIPKEWLDGRMLTPKIALTHENVEQRRAACGILGTREL
ncbi:MAG: hypothetical protein V3V61_03730 [Gammaproteobacteria bacterium]